MHLFHPKTLCAQELSFLFYSFFFCMYNNMINGHLYSRIQMQKCPWISIERRYLIRYSIFNKSN